MNAIPLWNGTGRLRPQHEDDITAAAPTSRGNVMGVSLDDLGHARHSLDCNGWNWRPTIEILRSTGLFDQDRLDHMGYNAGAEVSQEEARAIADFLDRNVLPSLSEGERILLDGSVTGAPDDGTFYRDPAEAFKNYAVEAEWLRKFSAFCRECFGFRVW
jgi:hypothetical protein